MPTSGTATYSLLGGTSPTEVAGLLTPGVLSAASMSVNFGAQTFSVALSGTVGGPTAFSGSGSGSITGSGLSTTLTGLVGASAERAGIAYSLTSSPYTIIGVAALKQ